jgi:hypothetical protein
MKATQTSVPIAESKFKKIIFAFLFSISIFFCYFSLTVNIINGDKLAIQLIDIYQHHVSDKIPFLKCKYKISCSEYSKNVIKEHGLRKGIILSFKRINSCM